MKGPLTPDQLWDGLSFDCLDWSCACGQPMGLEQFEIGRATKISCKNCGPIAIVTVKVDPLPEDGQ